MLENFLLVLQISVSIALVIVVVLQNKGGGVGSVFGGESVVYRSRRGVEKLLHYATIILAIVFASLSLSSVLLI